MEYNPKWQEHYRFTELFGDAQAKNSVVKSIFINAVLFLT